MHKPQGRVFRRIFLRNAKTQALRYLLWVELRDQDFYWGSPRSAPDAASTIVTPGEPTSITIPDNFENLPTAAMKTSFHQSGFTHVTSNGIGAQEVRDIYVGPITSFRQPTLFAALYCAVPRVREDHTRQPNRGGALALILEVPDSHWGVRWYVDFSVTPEGTFDQWQGVFLREGHQPSLTTSVTLSSQLDLILVVRAAPVGGELNDWHPDKDLMVMVTPAAVDCSNEDAPS